MVTKGTTVIAARLSNSLVQQVDKRCKYQRITRSVFLRKVLSWYLAQGPRWVP